MKRTICILLAALLLLSLAACAGPDKPEQTAPAPSGADAARQSDAGESGAPSPTPDPARQAFDPETDNDNRNNGLINCAMVETEEAYYLYANGYIMYYDKLMEDSDFLCPKPECVHDEKFQNPDCVARADIRLPSMTYYEGKLWWVGYPDYKHLGVFRMDLDGTNKELLQTWDLFGEDAPFSGMMLWYFHRGRLFYSCMKQEIQEGEAYNTASFGYMSLTDFEPHALCVRRSFFTPQPTMRFAGDSVYMFVEYDGIGPGDQEIPDGETDLEAYLAWRETVQIIDEVLRWDPTMDEPETVYLNREEHCFRSFNDFYVSQEGGIYFRESELEDPEQEYDQETNQYVTYINRVAGADRKERVLELTDEDGMHYNMYAMTGGVIVAMNVRYRPDEIRGIWILTLEGETLYRGELPMQYREKYQNRVRTDENGKSIPILHGLSGLNNCWATENEVLFCFEERYYKDHELHGDTSYYDFVKYEITPDGLVEIPLGECRAHYADEGW